ncbi:MAG: GAF domain-containing protein [Calditrichaeota bacterium]|nr:MAG: GAF domain-containing protein [Calditrichota bacterium]
MTDWKILEKIAEGTFGSLYKVENPENEDFCALKIFHSKFQNAEDRKRFFKSFQNASKITHPNCVKIIDWYEQDSQFGIVMEFVQGKPISSLKRKTDDSSVYSIGKIVQTMVQVCNGLSALHLQKIIHRDLKPENILLDKDLNVKITDFDFLKNIDATNLTTQGTFIGTVKYASPEQCEINTKLDQRSDLYSLGVIFYELLTGQVPFDGNNFAEIGIAHLKKELPKPENYFPQIPKEISKIITRLLEKKPKDRFQSVEEVISDLKDFLLKNKIELYSSQVYTLFPSEFYGRKKELSKLQKSVSEVGTTKLTLISGESGIGKTRLWNEFKTQNNFTYFETDCQKESSIYGALQEIVLQAINSIKSYQDSQKTALVGNFGWDLVNVAVQVAQMPFMQNLEKLPELSGKEGEMRLFQTVGSTLRNVAEKLDSKLVIYFDNLQWVDEVSLRFLAHFLKSMENENIVFVGACRKDSFEESYFFKIYEQLKNENFLTEIALNPLSVKASRKIVASLLRTKKVSEIGFKEKLLNQTFGNPLFIREFVHSLLDKKHLQKKDGNWILEIEKESANYDSESLHTLILNRLKTLDNEILEVLEFSSVLGKEFLIEDLVTLMKTELTSLQRILEFSKSFGVLEKSKDSKSFNFVHDAVRETLVADLDEELKQEINLKVGLFLEAKGENENLTEKLANHFFIAKESEKGFKYNFEAGKISQKKFAYGKALEYFKNAILLSESGKDSQKLLEANEQITNVLIEQGEFSKATELCKKMIEVSKSQKNESFLIIFYRQLGKSYIMSGFNKEAIETLEICLKICVEKNDVENIWEVKGNIGVAFQNLGNFAKAIEYYKERISAVSKLEGFKEDSKMVLNDTFNLATIYMQKGEFQICLEYINKYMEISKKLNLQSEIARANGLIATVLLYQRNSEEAEKHFLKAYNFYEKNGISYKIALISNNLGLLNYYSGNFKKAMFYFEKKLSISKEIGDEAGIALVKGNIGLILREKGEFEKALEYCQEFFEMNKKLSNKMGIMYGYGNISGIYTLQKDYGKALEYTENALELAKELGKQFYSGFNLDKANILYEIGKLIEAEESCKDGLELAKEINDSENVFRGKFLKIKISLKNSPLTNEVAESLIKLLSTTKDDEHKAEIYFELVNIYENLGNSKKEFEYKEKAKKLYSKLYGKTPKFIFKEQLEILNQEKKVAEMQNSNKLLQSIFRFLNPQTAFSELLNYLVEQCEADSCQIIFKDEASGNFELKAISQSLSKDDITFSRGIIEKCIEKEEPLRIENAVQEEEFQTNQSVIGKPFLSIIASPLISTKEGISGAIYLSRETLKIGSFSSSDVSEVQRIAELLIPLLVRQENDSQAKLDSEIQELGIFVGKSPKMKKVYEEIEEAANVNFTVYIQGETGTGKELVAEALHKLSPRKNEPFIAINCSAIPKGLAESELFGHTKGAFSGALSTKKGKFELAQNGTLFLDEIAELPLEIQAKLLRVIQKKEIWRVGGERAIKINSRIVVATHKDLKEEVVNGNFREDLFHRLDVLKIVVPPLRERKADILPLGFHFLEKFCKETGKEISGFSGTAVLGMENYDWRGNVRELENTIAKAVVKHKTGELLFVENIFDEETLKNVNKVILATKSGDSEIKSLYERMVNLKESFWEVISEPYLERELNRSQVKAVLEIGMKEVNGSLKKLSLLFQIPDTRQDYIKFMNFLRRNKLKD